MTTTTHSRIAMPAKNERSTVRLTGRYNGRLGREFGVRSASVAMDRSPELRGTDLPQSFLQAGAKGKSLRRKLSRRDGVERYIFRLVRAVLSSSIAGSNGSLALRTAPERGLPSVHSQHKNSGIVEL